MICRAALNDKRPTRTITTGEAFYTVLLLNSIIMQDTLGICYTEQQPAL